MSDKAGKHPDAGSPAARLLSLGFTEIGCMRLDNQPVESGNPGEEMLEQAAALGMKAVLTAALPLEESAPGEKEDLSAPGDPHGLIAPFARYNHYAWTVSLLKTLEREIREKTGLLRRDFRIFCNSRLPEKYLAERTGLGFTGKNTLLITPSRGSLAVLGGIFLPFYPEEEPSLLPEKRTKGSCGACRKCIDACPVGALSEPGILDRSRCLQSMATGDMPKEFQDAWQTRLYGCQICQDVCPWNRKREKKDEETGPMGAAGIEAEGYAGTGIRIPRDFPGYLGPSFPLRRILSAGDGVKQLFRGSVLDQKWIEGRMILRNALVAAGNHPEGAVLIPEILPYRTGPDPLLRQAAERALAGLS